jgi:hypothetical protein
MKYNIENGMFKITIEYLEHREVIAIAKRRITGLSAKCVKNVMETEFAATFNSLLDLLKKGDTK